MPSREFGDYTLVDYFLIQSARHGSSSSMPGMQLGDGEYALSLEVEGHGDFIGASNNPIDRSKWTVQTVSMSGALRVSAHWTIQQLVAFMRNLEQGDEEPKWANEEAVAKLLQVERHQAKVHLRRVLQAFLA